MKKLFLIFALLLTACASLPGYPGYISTKTSSFDGATETYMTPAVVYSESSGPSISLGLLKRSTMPADQIILIAEIRVVESFSEPSLMFNIDGEIVEFKSIDHLTEFDYEPGSSPGSGVHYSSTTTSSKRYRITKSFLYKILNANHVGVRLNFRTTYTEGVFSKGDISVYAKPAFREFYSKVFKEDK